MDSIFAYICEKLADSILAKILNRIKNHIRNKKIAMSILTFIVVILVVFCTIRINDKNNAKSIQKDAQEGMAARTMASDTVDEDIETETNEKTINSYGEDDAKAADESGNESVGNSANSNDNTEMNTVVTELTPDMLDNMEEQYLRFFSEEPSIIKPLSTAEFESVLRKQVYNVTQSVGSIDTSHIKDATIEQNNKLCEVSKTEDEAGDGIDSLTLLGIAITREKIAEELNHQPAMQLAANTYLKLMDMEIGSSDKLEYGYRAYKLYAKSVQIQSDKLDDAPYSLLNIGDIFYNLAQNAKVESKMPLYFKALIYYKAAEECYVPEVNITKDELQYMIGLSYHDLLKLYKNERNMIEDGQMISYLYKAAEDYYLRALGNNDATVENKAKYNKSLIYLRSGNHGNN